MGVQYFYRMEQKSKTNLYSVFLQVYSGIIIYRNKGMPKFFDQTFISASETYSRSLSHVGTTCHRWIGLRIAILNTYFLFLVYFIPIFVTEVIHKSNKDLWLTESWMTPLAVSWTYKAIRYLNQFFIVIPLFVKYIFSIKRAEEFLEHPMIVDVHPAKIDPEAPHAYSIEMKNASYSYGFNQKALWGINLKIERGKKIAIVGGPATGKHS